MTTTASTLPAVGECAVSACGYNKDSACHAGAITVVGDSARCGTFLDISFSGGPETVAKVGACHRSECRFNESLACAADSVRVGPGSDVADCLTYEAA